MILTSICRDIAHFKIVCKQITMTLCHRFYQFWLVLPRLQKYLVRFFQSFSKSLNLDNSGTRRDVEKWQTATFLTFEALSDGTINFFKYYWHFNVVIHNFWNLKLNARCQTKVFSLKMLQKMFQSFCLIDWKDSLNMRISSDFWPWQSRHSKVFSWKPQSMLLSVEFLKGRSFLKKWLYSWSSPLKQNFPLNNDWWESKEFWLNVVNSQSGTKIPKWSKFENGPKQSKWLQWIRFQMPQICQNDPK